MCKNQKLDCKTYRKTMGNKYLIIKNLMLKYRNMHGKINKTKNVLNNKKIELSEVNANHFTNETIYFITK